MNAHALIPGAGWHPAPRETEHAIEEKAFGFWIYLMSDAIIFALLFATYAVMRHSHAGGPMAHDLLELPHVFAETVLLLSSTMTFAFATASINAKRKGQALSCLLVTFLLGLGFVAMEVSEFRGLVAAGAGPDRSGFLSAFFTLVGTHGLHVTIGLIWIVMLAVQVLARGLTPHVTSRLHRLGLFWHFLDIVWIGIFSIVYLPGGL